MCADVARSFVRPWPWLALLSTVIVFLAAPANACTVAPLVLPLKNYTLADGIALNRGIWLGLGAADTVSLRLTTTFNNTRVRNAGDCDHQGRNASNLDAQCQGASGSSVDVSRLSSWISVDPGDWNVSSADPRGPDETILDGYVNASLSGSVAVPMLPLEVWSNLRASNRSGLALGLASSFTERLLALGLAPSRAFGLFFGSRSQARPMDGSLVIGGYDAARVGGPWTNFTTGSQYLPTNCPLQVRISNILLNNSRGSHSLMVDNRSTVAACVDPHQNAFTFTPAIFARWANLTNHPDPNAMEAPSQLFPAAQEHLLGNLTVVLSNGHTTVIPHHELVTPERGSDEQGKYAVLNTSNIMAAVGTGSPNSYPILGGVYLSQNYLFVDYDRGTFSMAPAVNDAQDEGRRRIETICSPARSQRVEGDSKTRLSGGGIAGVVIGSTVAAGLVGYLLWRICWRRGPKSQQPSTEEAAAGQAQSSGHRPSDTSELPTFKAELDSKTFTGRHA